MSTAVDRLQGYRQTLLEAGLPVDDSLIASLSHQDDAADLTGYQAMKELLQLTPRPDGVFCHNDPMALGAMRAIIEAGLRIPEDIAIVGAGNVQYASALRIPLSSVDQQSDTLGSRAAHLALALISAKQTRPPEEILIQPKLVARESSLRIKAQRPSDSGDSLQTSDSNVDGFLRMAIEGKRMVRLRYKSKDRIVEPHDYGMQNGCRRLLGYQIAGSSSGTLPNWRWMDVDLISDFELLDREFQGGRPVPSGKHHKWDQLFVRVKPPDENSR